MIFRQLLHATRAFGVGGMRTRATPPRMPLDFRDRNASPIHDVRLGLAANWQQFTLLVVINGFVGAMVGLERAVLPLVAAKEFGVASSTAALSFIATFGLAKALANLATGAIADSRGRRFALIVGWVLALPVPVIVLVAREWWWIVAANALLGVSQGLAWSATVLMKIDLAGPRQRGLAMGLNEFAGYVALAVAAFASGVVASNVGLRSGPAYIGLAIAVVGLGLSVAFARETNAHVQTEERALGPTSTPVPTPAQLLRRSVWSDRAMFSLSQAGLVNNLNDGLAWGALPLLFASASLDVAQISALAAIYPAVWGFGQLATGPLGDRWGRKWLIVAGMVVQGIALAIIAASHSIAIWTVALVALGIGTALVYPTLLAAVSDVSRPLWRASAVGVYRFWRDMGYMIGALLAGFIADAFGLSAAIMTVGVLTVASGVLVGIRFEENRHREAALL
jgi:MFS family permease